MISKTYLATILEINSSMSILMVQMEDRMGIDLSRFTLLYNFVLEVFPIWWLLFSPKIKISDDILEWVEWEAMEGRDCKESLNVYEMNCRVRHSRTYNRVTGWNWGHFYSWWWKSTVNLCPGLWLSIWASFDILSLDGIEINFWFTNVINKVQLL
jgi:hypothetical protein